MSVIKSKRNLASSQFLIDLSAIESEVDNWCESQSRKHDNYGLVELSKMVRFANTHAILANQRYLKSTEDAEFRKKHFNFAISFLKLFNIRLTTIKSQNKYNLSNTKVKRWMKLEKSARKQIESIKKTDTERIKKSQNTVNTNGSKSSDN